MPAGTNRRRARSLQPLVEKYRPATLDALIGLARPRAVLTKLAAAPWESSFLLVGPSGTGKTTAGLALAAAIPAELHHIASRQCDLATVEELCRRCHYVPFHCEWHVALIDEADQMTRA